MTQLLVLAIGGSRLRKLPSIALAEWTSSNPPNASLNPIGPRKKSAASGIAERKIDLAQEVEDCRGSIVKELKAKEDGVCVLVNVEDVKVCELNVRDFVVDELEVGRSGVTVFVVNVVDTNVVDVKEREVSVSVVNAAMCSWTRPSEDGPPGD